MSAFVGGRGGGKSHIAQAGVEDTTKIDEALESGANTVKDFLREAEG